jgi:heat shock protein HslJ
MYQAKHRIVPAMALTTSLLLAACGTTSTDNTAADWSSVADQEWNLVQVKDGAGTLSPAPPVMATATFSADGTVSGNAGCNQYSGSYEQSGSSLSVAQLAMTRKLCIADDAMKVENAFSGAFVLVSSWDVNDGNLVLKDHNGNTVIKLTPVRP